MSEGLTWLVLGAALALASYSVRLLIQAPSMERPRKGALLCASALLGVLLGAWALGWESWPAGVVAGLAVVELGPAVLKWARGRLTHKTPGEE